MKKDIIIFTDGSSSGNPGPGGWGAIVYIKNKDSVIELGGGHKHTTNNRMEMTAIIEALLFVKNMEGSVTIYTDSSYVVNGITKWIEGWESRGWKTADKKIVSNQDLWQKMIIAKNEKEYSGDIAWEIIPGHSGILGNERADMVATSYTTGKPIELFGGTLEDYETHIGGSILNIEATVSRDKKKRNTGKAFSYVSMVDGVIQTHKTWLLCEEMVKGVSGAKFKKAKSREEEESIIKEWENS